jgi:hypothetical protein
MIRFMISLRKIFKSAFVIHNYAGNPVGNYGMGNVGLMLCKNDVLHFSVNQNVRFMRYISLFFLAGTIEHQLCTTHLQRFPGRF